MVTSFQDGATLLQAVLWDWRGEWWEFLHWGCVDPAALPFLSSQLWGLHMVPVVRNLVCPLLCSGEFPLPRSWAPGCPLTVFLSVAPTGLHGRSCWVQAFSWGSHLEMQVLMDLFFPSLLCRQGGTLGTAFSSCIYWYEYSKLRYLKVIILLVSEVTLGRKSPLLHVFHLEFCYITVVYPDLRCFIIK